jgi:2-polyprenyl-3-methyl-5-hydroxy-6-metoxy-1,4-benzoquinol methylase
MSDEAAGRFGPGVVAWIDGIGSVRDAVRQELVSRQLLAHLPRTPARLRVIDGGCGQGTQAIALARLGHEVVGIDTAEEMLAEARESASAQPEAVRARLRFEPGDVLALDESTQERYDVICCHGVAMYLPSLTELVGHLVCAARPGGLISLLTRNRAGIAMRAGMTQQWADALLGFEATHYTNRLGIQRARADDPADVRSALREAGADTIAWYGVRLFSDHWDRDVQPDDFEAVIKAEEEAGRRDPYRALAALTHTLATVR